jgi:endonuclease/exonuclease/phosphatase (EEP) superfamily protein YafD
MKKRRIFTLVCLITSGSLFIWPADMYYLDLLQSFSFHAMLGFLLLSGLLAYLRWKIPALGALLLSLLLAMHLIPHINSSHVPEHVSPGHPLKVAHFNVLANNPSHEASIRLALETGADVISFQEVNMRWINVLMDGLAKQYPYYAFTNGGVHGVALFSKHPLENVKTYQWTGEPNLTGDLIVGGQQLHFVATHTLSPRTAERYANRNQHLEEMGRYVSRQKGAVIAIGDLNAVPWSRGIVKMKAIAALSDSRRGVVPTYPSNLREGGIPIDYILHSEEITCLNFQAVEPAGSDHRGVIGHYMLQEGVGEAVAENKYRSSAITEAPM